MDGREFQIGNVSLFIVKKGLFLSVYVDDIKLAGKKKILIRCGKYSIKKLTWENEHLSWIMYTWDALNVNAKSAKILLTITEPCLNLEFLRGDWKNYHSLKILVFPHGRMTWWVMQRSVWNDIVSWQTKLHNNSIRYLPHALMTITSKKKKQNL